MIVNWRGSAGGKIVMTHVLIVEDHAENRNLLRLLLEVNGYRVTGAGDGLEALAAARTDAPDVIVSDALMPNMDGFALCRAWMQDPALKAIPFVFYSSTYVQSEHEQFAQTLGAVRYLIKPLEAKLFLEELRAVLQQWAGRAAPVPAVPLDVAASHAMHETVLARKLEDKIAQLEQANRKLQESEARFRNLTEMSSDFYWESDAEHRLALRTAADTKSSTVSVFERGAQIGERRWDIPYLSPDAAGWAAHRATLDAREPFRDFVLSRQGADGSERFISISGDPVFDGSGAFTGYRGVGTDITARRRNEENLRASEDRYRDLVENSQDLVCTHDLEGRLLSVNAAAVKLTGYTREALLGMNLADLLTPGARAGFAAYLEELRTKGEARGLMHIRTAKGDARWWEYDNTLRTDNVAAPVVRGMAQDVTEIRRAERARRSSEDKFRKAFNLNPDAISINRVQDGRYVSTNRGFTQITGYTEAEAIGLPSLELDIWNDPSDRARLIEGLKKDGAVANLDARFCAKDGRILDGLMSAAVIDIDDVPHVISITRDVTERTRALQALAESEERFRSLVEQSITGISIVQDGVTTYANPRVAEIFGYVPEEIIGQPPTLLVAEEDRALVEENIRRRMAGEVRSIQYSFTGRRKDGSRITVDVHGAVASVGGRPAIIGMMQDISEKARAEEQINRYVTQLKGAFMSTVKVATTLGEMRDPYTAGHQRRVAEIAVAIGAEMGLDARAQEGLRVAGYLHDIGKINIPAEMLSKPGKLSAIEYQLIKGHPQSGYDVLKDVDFPWPVAEVALQHHERVDGSGYPQGLKGEAIRLEARITAVADVIEAMSSHRPYRAGLGIDKSLAEIERGSGSAYDVNVVNACLRLFREKGYSIPT